MIMLGYALQKGWLPVSLEAITRAIEINGTAVKANLSALDWGRRAACDEAAVLRMFQPEKLVTWLGGKPEPLQTQIDKLSSELRAYQNKAYAARYTALMQQVQQAERQTQLNTDALARTVARQAYRLMAYKDEYEVARLYTDGRFEKQLQAQFDGPIRLTLHLAPPLLAQRDPLTGHLKKRAFGPWVLGAMRGLARLKGLRGGWLDPFGRSTERRLERQLAALYPAMIECLLPTLTADNHAQVLALARIAEEVRGFGHIKERQLKLTASAWRQACVGTPAEAMLKQFADNVERVPVSAHQSRPA